MPQLHVFIISWGLRLFDFSFALRAVSSSMRIQFDFDSTPPIALVPIGLKAIGDARPIVPAHRTHHVCVMLLLRRGRHLRHAAALRHAPGLPDRIFLIARGHPPRPESSE